jgi:hypothetical protein
MLLRKMSGNRYVRKQKKEWENGGKKKRNQGSTSAVEWRILTLATMASGIPTLEAHVLCSAWGSSFPLPQCDAGVQRITA